MSEEEINKTIAKYMGYKHDNTEYDNIVLEGRYTKSMDALLPVALKLNKESSHVSTEVYGNINSWAARGLIDYDVYPLAKGIADIIKTWVEGGE